MNYKLGNPGGREL